MMLRLVTALPCEAAPLIDYFGLKQAGGHGGAAYYQSQEVGLACTGIGSLRSAIGTTAFGWMMESNAAQDLWLNVGTCAHRSAPIGSALIANKLTAEGGRDAIYPQFPWRRRWMGCELKTVSRPVRAFGPTEVAYDMEAYGFWRAANAFAPSERAHCVKVVSDNAEHPADSNFSQSQVSAWIASLIPTVESLFAEAASAEAKAVAIDGLIHAACQFHKFSATERHRLEGLLADYGQLAPAKALESVESLARDARDKRSFLVELESESQALAAKRVTACSTAST